MPIYEYSCQKCGRIIEILARIGEVLDKCPDCGGEVKRDFSKSNFVIRDKHGMPLRFSR